MNTAYHPRLQDHDAGKARHSDVSPSGLHSSAPLVSGTPSWTCWRAQRSMNVYHCKPGRKAHYIAVSIALHSPQDPWLYTQPMCSVTFHGICAQPEIIPQYAVCACGHRACLQRINEWMRQPALHSLQSCMSLRALRPPPPRSSFLHSAPSTNDVSCGSMR